MRVLTNGHSTRGLKPAIPIGQRASHHESDTIGSYFNNVARRLLRRALGRATVPARHGLSKLRLVDPVSR